jgi:RNA polymerase sigma-70 factor (ECF subfamily)
VEKERGMMNPDRSIDENGLITRLKQGDESCLVQLMDHYGAQLMHYLVSILGKKELAEDVFQDTWVRVLEKIGSFRHEMSFAPWLFRIARNRAYDLFREKRRWQWIETPLENGESQPLEFPAPADFDDAFMREETAHKLLKALDPLYREVLWLRFFQDKSYEEIADFCRLPMGTVKSRLCRALDQAATLYSRMKRRTQCVR